MGRYEDLTGRQFNDWKVLSKTQNIGKETAWLCECKCGEVKAVQANSLKSGNSRSCVSCGNKTHGLRHNKLYDVWSQMCQRTKNKNFKCFKNYGERNITVCKEWEEDFVVFYNWSLENGYKQGLSLDRKNNNGNYEPNNCRWITHKEQQNNKRTNVFVEYNGQIKTVAQWSEVLGINYNTLRKRLRKWSVERAFTENVNSEYARERRGNGY